MPPGALGLVPLLGRDPLALASFEGRALFLFAVDALVAAGVDHVLVLVAPDRLPAAAEALGRDHPTVELVECPTVESRLREAVSGADRLVVHDPLCPLVPASVLRTALASWEPRRATVPVLAVVDTVKAAGNGIVQATLDRDALRVVGSPVVLDADLLRDLPDLAATLGRPSALVEELAGRVTVDFVAASPMSLRAEDASSLRVLASVDALALQRSEG